MLGISFQPAHTYNTRKKKVVNSFPEPGSLALILLRVLFALPSAQLAAAAVRFMIRAFGFDSGTLRPRLPCSVSHELRAEPGITNLLEWGREFPTGEAKPSRHPGLTALPYL